MADATARRFPEARLTATDLDPAMVRAASARLSAIPNASAEVADVTDLSFADASFDVVLSHLMLHHVIDWEPALAEVRRVLRPGGMLLGYDLTRTLPNSVVHRVDRSPHRLISAAELESRLRELAFSEVAVRPAFAGQVMRFRATV